MESVDDEFEIFFVEEVRPVYKHKDCNRIYGDLGNVVYLGPACSSPFGRADVFILD